MMVLLELFVSFLKIGFTSFGGLSMIPLITSEMTAHGWMTASEVSDIVASAEMTPGPLGLNAAEPGGVSWPAIGIGALGLLLLVRFKVSIPKVICLSGALGMLLFGVMGLN